MAIIGDSANYVMQVAGAMGIEDVLRELHALARCGASAFPLTICNFLGMPICQWVLSAMDSHHHGLGYDVNSMRWTRLVCLLLPTDNLQFHCRAQQRRHANLFCCAWRVSSFFFELASEPHHHGLGYQHDVNSMRWHDVVPPLSH
jgi:hypothetical protein